VFGDQGPRIKIGEASVELLRRLGQERIRPNGSVILAGTPPGVVSIVFPGSGSTAGQDNEAALLAAIDGTGQARFAALGGRPSG
jgi:hypothetical protein